MNFKVDAAVRIKAKAAADHLGISVAEYYRELARRDVVDRSGKPHWQAVVPPRVSGTSSNAIFDVDAEIYSKAAKAAGQLRISVAEYYRQLVRRDHVDENGRPLWCAAIQPPLDGMEVNSQPHAAVVAA
ncbi:hypothetical protein [Nonomuraea sp. NPDC049695]|uniref:hypothetical protein n=1 Tax=Nonomuraea sp. NPDC049695 TaxID=3154734 RepID=UPI003423E2A2